MKGIQDTKPVLVSACLLGFPCRHDGKAKISPSVIGTLKSRPVVPFCPEAACGLGIPREPFAFDKTPEGPLRGRGSGTDATEEFKTGAHLAQAVIKHWEIDTAILKQNSPSCGRDLVYVRATDGSESKQPGQGVTARALAALNVRLGTEEDLL